MVWRWLTWNVWNTYRMQAIAITLVLTAVLFAAGYFFLTGIHPIVMGLAVVLVGLPGFILLLTLVGSLMRLLAFLPARITLLVLSFFLALYALKSWRFGWPDGIYYTSLGLLALGMWLVVSSRGKWRWLMVALTAGGLSWFGYWLMNPGKRILEKPPTSYQQQMEAPNPATPGRFNVRYMTYGSGTDPYRPEYSDSVSWKSDSIDAHLIIPEWKGDKAKWRKRFWGFDSHSFPVNGRIWLPEASGPRPIVLMVHGNHSMEDFSDAGYAYLGELLASQGYATVSVDENFINGTWSGDFRGKEMPARAYLLLKHLEQLRAWSNDRNHTLYNAIDTENVVLIGHSRGGEAVAIAAVYNRLPSFPDNAHVPFNFNFGIKGLVAIAPTDKRYFRRVNPRNVSYLSIQGSLDSDESSFFGIRQMQRVQLDSGNFKAGLYIHGANHGQFNTSWGGYDSGPPFKWLLDIKPLISGEEQREIARVYIAAFVHDVFTKPRYAKLFKSAYAAGSWLPNLYYATEYVKHDARTLAGFDEDLNTRTTPSGTATAELLHTWYEERTTFRDEDYRGTRAVVLGWKDTLQTPSYTMQLSEKIPTDSSMELSLNLAAGNPKLLKLPDSVQAVNDFTIITRYASGTLDSLMLSQIKPLNPQFKIRFSKMKKLNENWGSEWEPVFESYFVPVRSADSLLSVQFLFNKSPGGIIHLDHLSLQSR